MTNIEPLEYLLNKYSFKQSDLKQIVFGIKYTAVLLQNGNIGVCANLQNTVSADIEQYKIIDLENITHRIILTAYFNACFNQDCNENADLIQSVDYSKYSKITMLGYIKPIAKQLKSHGIELDIFDFLKNDEELKPLEEKENSVKTTDALILTSTSIFNNTFLETVNNTKQNCDIFIIGPSSIMTPEILKYRNVKMIFGAYFEKNDGRVLETIANNHGTRKFLKFGKKCSYPSNVLKILDVGSYNEL